MTNPASSLVERFANWKLQPVHSTEITNHQEIGSIPRPVCPLHMLEDFTWSSASQRSAGKGAHADPGADGFAVEQNRHFGAAGNCHQLRTAQAHGPRLRSLGPGGEIIERIALPRRAVQNGVSIWSESRGTNAAAAERKLPVEWRAHRYGAENQLAGE